MSLKEWWTKPLKTRWLFWSGFLMMCAFLPGAWIVALRSNPIDIWIFGCFSAFVAWTICVWYWRNEFKQEW